MNESNPEEDQLMAEFRDNPTPRSGQPWAEEDFAAIMQLCRSGASIEQIARRIGRSPTSLPMQVRRMLPLEERHLTAELALPRLRQLDENEDYDWLAAMARREQTVWERNQEAQAERRERGLDALPDEHILSVALALVSCTIEVPADLRREWADQLIVRQLDGRLEQRAAEASRETAERLTATGTYGSQWGDAHWPEAM